MVGRDSLMPALKQRWVLNPDYYEDRAIHDEVMEIQQENLYGNGSYINFSLDDDYYVDDEGKEILPEEKYPAIAAALKEQGITKCLVLIWW